MNRLSNKRFLIYGLLIFLLIIPFAFAATDAISQVFQSIGIRDIIPTYLAYAPFIDAVLYIWIFIALAQSIFAKKFPETKAIGTVIGIMLGIAMAIFESQAHFNLSNMMWIAAIIIFSLFGYGIYTTLTSLGSNKLSAFSAAFLLMWVLVENLQPVVKAYIGASPLLSTIWSIVFLVTIIGLVMGLIRLVSGFGSGAQDLQNAGRTRGALKRALKWWNDDSPKADKLMTEINADTPGFEAKLNELQRIAEDISMKSELDREQQIKYVQYLEKALENTAQVEENLQKITANLGNPAYAKYAGSLQTIINSLTTYVNALRTVTTRLIESIEKTMIEENREEGILKSIKEQSDNLSKVLTLDSPKVKDMLKQFSSLSKMDSTTDEIVHNIIANIEQECKSFADQFKTDKDYTKIFNELNTSINTRDKNNIIQLKNIISYLQTNLLEKKNTIYNNINYQYEQIQGQSLAKIKLGITYVRVEMTNIVEIQKNRDNILKEMDQKIKDMEKIIDTQVPILIGKIKTAKDTIKLRIKNDATLFTQLITPLLNVTTDIINNPAVISGKVTTDLQNIERNTVNARNNYPDYKKKAHAKEFFSFMISAVEGLRKAINNKNKDGSLTNSALNQIKSLQREIHDIISDLNPTPKP